MTTVNQDRRRVLIPKKLQAEGLIGIVSPSAAITPTMFPQLRKGREYLHNMGFRTEVSKNYLKELDGSAGTPQERAEDINSMFADTNIDAIICSQGGDTANSVLPYLDFNLIKENPKIFMGISDITVMLNALYSKTGLVTFHGNDIMWGFGRKPTAYDTRELIDRLVTGKIGKISKNSKWKTIREGIAEGRLIGGNLQCILKLAGTIYQPDFQDSILFLEDYDTTSEKCSYMFHQLRQMGAFENVKGIVIGYILGLQKSAKTRKKGQMEDVLERTTSHYDFPIVKCDDFGHNHSNTVLPLGVRARLSGMNTDSKLEILENCVI